jgi:hypothetical protein
VTGPVLVGNRLEPQNGIAHHEATTHIPAATVPAAMTTAMTDATTVAMTAVKIAVETAVETTAMTGMKTVVASAPVPARQNGMTGRRFDEKTGVTTVAMVVVAEMPPDLRFGDRAPQKKTSRFPLPPPPTSQWSPWTG